MRLKRILPKYVHFNGLKLNGALEEFSITSQFCAQKCHFFLKKIRVLRAIFFELKYR